MKNDENRVKKYKTKISAQCLLLSVILQKEVKSVIFDKLKKM